MNFLESLLVFLGGVFLGIGFFAEKFILLGLTGIALFLFLLEKNKKRFFWTGFLFSFGFAGALLVWVFEMLPLNWIGIENQALAFLIVILIWLFLSSVIGVFGGMFGIAFSAIKKGKLADLIYFGFLWVLIEYSRDLIFSFLFWNKGMPLGNHWTLPDVGYLLSFSSARLLARWGGVYLMSFVLVVAGGMIYFLTVYLKGAIREKNTKRIIWLFAILGGELGVLFFNWESAISFSDNSQKEFLTAVATTEFDSFFVMPSFEIKERKLREQNIFSQIIKNNPFAPRKIDIIVFPEDSRLLKFNKDFLLSLVESKRIPENVIVVDSSRESKERNTLSMISFWQPDKGLIGWRHKKLLTPFGEYLPWVVEKFVKLLASEWLGNFKIARGYQSVNEIKKAFFARSVSLVGFVCEEGLSSLIIRRLSRENNILFNLASHGFVRGSKILDKEMQRVLVIRSVETNRYLVRSTNEGQSYIIDNWGHIIASGREKPVFAKIKAFGNRTFYCRFGDWIILAAGLLIMFRIRRY